MKNKPLKIASISIAALLFAVIPAFAATLTLSPSSVNVKPGQSFNVVVALDPQGVKGTTIKMELKFPSDLVQVKSFNFASNGSWIALAQPGYDLTDNAGGVLIKTAGYPGGVSAPMTFGTVSFLAKKVGSGTISAGGGTLVLDAGNANTFSGANQVAVTVTAPAVLPAATNQISGTVVSPSPSISPEPAISVGPEGQAVSKGGLFAAIGSVITFGTGNKWLGGLAVLVLIIVVYYLVKAILRKPKGKTPA